MLRIFIWLCLAGAVAAQTEMRILERYTGNAAGSEFGRSVAMAGDVNADGYDDVIVGAPADGTGGVDAGAVFVYSGLDRSLLMQVVGQTGDRLGASVSGAGDYDGDGFDDLVIGAPGAALGSSNVGFAAVYSGASGQPIAWHYGLYTDQYMGFGVSGAGDLNGDGFDDIVVWPQYDAPVVIAGPASNVMFAVPPVPQHWSGWSACGAGDVDGDGRDDLLVGSRSVSASGQSGRSVNVYSGANNFAPIFSLGLGSSPYGPRTMGLAGLGDLDGDGRGEFLVGTEAGGPGSIAGQAVVFSGASGTPLFTAQGGADFDHFGHAVASAGDLDGDGVPDFAVGAPQPGWSGVSGSVGTGYVNFYSGATFASLGQTTGDNVGDALGGSIGGPGDATGDGLGDVVIGRGLYITPANGCRLVSRCAARGYGFGAGGGNTLSLIWAPPSTVPLTAGTAVVTGATPGAVGFAVLSTGRGSQVFGAFTALVDLSPGAWVGLLGSFDATGSYAMPVDLVQPWLAGLSSYVQVLDTNPAVPAVSNGLELLFAP